MAAFKSKKQESRKRFKIIEVKDKEKIKEERRLEVKDNREGR